MDGSLLRISDRIIPEPNSGCYLWLGRLDKGGYARLGKRLVHRMIFAAVNGPIPTGLNVLHTCDNPACCNTEHLYLGTQKDNMADRVKRGHNPDHRGSKHPRARFTEQQIADMRAAPGLQREIAAQYGISQSHVSRIKLRKLWPHVG